MHRQGLGGAHDFVRVHDRLEAVRDGENGDVTTELSPQRLLDNRVCFVVYKGLSAQDLL